MTDEHWEKIIQAICIEAEEGGFDGDVMRKTMLFKKNWDFYCDEAAVEAYVVEKRLAKLRAHKEELEARLPNVETEIARLDALVNPEG